MSQLEQDKENLYAKIRELESQLEKANEVNVTIRGPLRCVSAAPTIQ